MKAMVFYSIGDIARKAGIFSLPETGSWVCVTGCPVWPRGRRLIPAHRDIGIQHLDIYWSCKEVLAVHVPKVNRYRRRRIELSAAVAYDVSMGRDLEHALDRAVGELRDYMTNPSWMSPSQYSLVTISFPHPEEVRFYNGEIRVFSAETIRLLLEEDQVEVIPFGESQRVILEDVARELADAYQIDGLSWAQAYQEIVGLGIVEPGGFVPQWFYRPRGWFRQQFCEEEEVSE